MHNNRLNALYDTLYGDEPVEALYQQFGQPDWFTSQAVEELLDARSVHREIIIFEYIGIDESEQASFIDHEINLIRYLLQPIALLKYPDDLNGAEKGALFRAFEKAVECLDSTLDYYSKRLNSNYNERPPMTVANLKSYITSLFQAMAEHCFCRGFLFDNSPFGLVVHEWLTHIEIRYAPSVLSERLERLKQDSHSMHQTALSMEDAAAATNTSPRAQVLANALAQPAAVKKLAADIDDKLAGKLNSIDFLDKEPAQENRKSDTIEAIVNEGLSVLSWKNTDGYTVMSDADYERVVDYTVQLVKSEQVPKEMKPIESIGVTNEFLLHTFYRLKKRLHHRRVKPYWAPFLRLLFKRLAGAEEKSIKKNWSQYRPKPPYEKQVAKMKAKTYPSQS